MVVGELKSKLLNALTLWVYPQGVDAGVGRPFSADDADPHIPGLPPPERDRHCRHRFHSRLHLGHLPLPRLPAGRRQPRPVQHAGL